MPSIDLAFKVSRIKDCITQVYNSNEGVNDITIFVGDDDGDCGDCGGGGKTGGSGSESRRGVCY